MSKRGIEEIINDAAEKYKLGYYEHLNLYLIASERMPAGYISFRLEDERRSETRISDLDMGLIKSERKAIKYLLKNELGLNAKLSGIGVSSYFCMGKKKILIGIQFSVSKDSYRNKEHMYARDHFTSGMASGFPHAAVLRYSVEPWRILQVNNIIYKEVRKDPASHIEQAYLLWVPEGADRNTGEIGPTSKQKCIEIMEFVRKNNPKLAEIVENHFIESLK